MRNFHYRCLKCSNLVEVSLTLYEEIPENVPCQCGGVYQRVWLQAPSMHGDISPYFDVQLGVEIQSKQHRDAILRQKGLVAVGPDEMRHTSSQAHDREPQWNSEEFRDVCQKVWHQIETKEIPLIDAKPLPDHVADRDSAIIKPVE